MEWIDNSCLLILARGYKIVVTRQRAEVLCKLYPNIEKAYHLAQGLNYIFENNTHKDVARLKLAHWYNKVEKTPII
jgi:hypothetical protein